MERLHVEPLPEHKFDLLTPAEIRQPVPAERAFDADDQVTSNRSDELEKRLRAVHNVAVSDDVAGGTEHAGITSACADRRHNKAGAAGCRTSDM